MVYRKIEEYGELVETNKEERVTSFPAYKVANPRSRRTSLFMAGIVMLLGMCFYIGPVSEAKADTQNFCSNAWLDRYGQSNDSCAANDLHYNFQVYVSSNEHSACVSTTVNTSKSGLNATWTCTGGAWQQIWKWVSPKVLTNGIIRNNATGDTNHASGAQSWCPNYNCGQ